VSTTPLHDVNGILLPPSQKNDTKCRKPNPRHQTFIHHYLQTGNATKSAILAGYSEKSAAAAGSRLLTNPEIKGAIDTVLLRQAELSGISATYVLEGIRAIADDPDARHADRLRALELLGKHLRLFSDRIEQDTQITVTIERIGA
jgi:phage terminase small subunit